MAERIDNIFSSFDISLEELKSAQLNTLQQQVIKNEISAAASSSVNLSFREEGTDTGNAERAHIYYKGQIDALTYILELLTTLPESEDETPN